MEERNKTDNYNWWEDPVNRTFIQIPVSIVGEEGWYCIISSNSYTEKLIGQSAPWITASANSRQEAIDKFFELFRSDMRHSEFLIMKYQRWVPLKIGAWFSAGGTWFSIFGFRFYFRYGSRMKGGWHVPFTKLNISFHNEWRQFNRFRKKKNCI